MAVLQQVVVLLGLALLAAATTTTTSTTTTTTTNVRQVQRTFTWKWNDYWTTPANWASGVCPVWGDVVTFPDFVENFGLSDCASATDPSCVRGGIISLSDDPSSSAPYFQAQASAVQFPSDSVFSFDSDGDISFAQAVVTQVNSWNDRGPEHRDFQCADNWNVDGTGNKDFYSPCFSDVVDLSNTRNMMMDIPSFSFISSVMDPNNLLTNQRMVSGELLRFDSINCPQLFSSNSGSEFCTLICMNSCPTLNPDKKTGVLNAVDDLEVIQGFIDTAVEAANNQLSQLNTPVDASGTVTFLADNDVLQPVLAIVALRASEDLASVWDVKVTFTCDPAAGGVWGIDCTVKALIPQAKIAAYCLSLSGEWIFREGLLNSVFGTLVSYIFAEENNKYLLAMGQKQSQTPFVSAQFDVPQRFITELGVPLPTEDIANALGARLGVNASDINAISTYNSTKSGQAGFSFAVFTSNATFTTSFVQTTVLAASARIPIFSVPLSSGLTIFLYNPILKETASAAKLSVVEVVLLNQAIYNALPFSTAGHDAFVISVKAFLQSRNVNGYLDIIQMDCYKDPSKLYASRRRNLVPQIVIAMTVPSTSALLVNSGLNTLFGQFSWSGSASTAVGTAPKYLSVDALTRDITNSSLAQYQSNINAANNSIGVLGNQILNSGSSPQAAAEGSYSWNNITTYVAALNNPSITNMDCDTVNTRYATNVTGLVAQFQREVAVMLPISAGSVTVKSPIQCIPANPLKTLPYQAAYFAVSITIDAPFIYFASDANYVTYASDVDSALQFLEDTAPLNLVNVRDAINRALHSIVLAAYDTQLAADIWALQSSIGITTTTPAPETTASPAGPASPAASTGSAGLGLAVVAGAGAGAVVLIAVVVIVVIVSRRKKGPAKSERTVVAFENPMYDNTANIAAGANKDTTYDQTAEAQGLYDEPAFKTAQDKENPVYESTDNLADGNMMHDDGPGAEAELKEDGGYLDVNAE